MLQVFDYLPSVELLQSLVQGSLKQTDVLSQAIRLWVLLRSLYGEDADSMHLNLGQKFSYSDWRKAFFQDSDRFHKKDEISDIHHPDCPCAKTIAEWLFEDKNLAVNQQEWQAHFCQRYSISSPEMGKILSPVEWVFARDVEISEEQKKLFYQRYPETSQKEINGLFRGVKKPEREQHKNRPLAFSRKSIQSDFATLVERGWLKKLGKQYYKVDEFPALTISMSTLKTAESIDFLEPDLADLASNYYKKINGNSRFFIHVDYIASPEARQKIDNWQDQLKNIWQKTPLPPVKLIYDSASLWREVPRIVYPVCIYYYQRAPYLCAFGQTPQNRQELGWYNYRLDRILELTELRWDDESIPGTLRDKCQNIALSNSDYSPDRIAQELGNALGFDFYRPSDLMLLRFERDFHDRYIQDTVRHDRFELIATTADVVKLIKKSTSNPQQQKKLLEIVQRFPDDAYYHVPYRVGDNNVIMRLRAWGQKVEVLLPGQLRERIADDLRATHQLYQ
jgi:CRISPR-associated protein (TIGR03985 family)